MGLGDVYKRQALYVALVESADDWSSGRYDSILARIQQAMDDSAQYVTPALGMDYQDVKTRIRSYMEARKATHNIPTGIPLIDQRLRGGIEPGNLGIVMAPSGRGKTLSLVNFGAAAVVSGYNVAHITIGDVPELVVGQRYDARLSGVPANAIAKGASGFVKHVIRATKNAKGRLWIKEYTAHAANVVEIQTYLKRLQETCSVKIDLVIIDYADLIRVAQNNREAGRYRELGDVIIGLRSLAGELRVPVWTASQTGRPAYKSKNIGLSDIWESIEKVQHSDIVIGMAQHESERKNGRFRFVLLKNRLGGHEGFSVSMQANMETQTIAQTQNQIGEDAP